MNISDLKKSGAKINFLEKRKIEIIGVKKLRGIRFSVISDTV